MQFTLRELRDSEPKKTFSIRQKVLGRLHSKLSSFEIPNPHPQPQSQSPFPTQTRPLIPPFTYSSHYQEKNQQASSEEVKHKRRESPLHLRSRMRDWIEKKRLDRKLRKENEKGRSSAAAKTRPNPAALVKKQKRKCTVKQVQKPLPRIPSYREMTAQTEINRMREHAHLFSLLEVLPAPPKTIAVESTAIVPVVQTPEINKIESVDKDSQTEPTKVSESAEKAPEPLSAPVDTLVDVVSATAAVASVEADAGPQTGLATPVDNDGTDIMDEAEIGNRKKKPRSSSHSTRPWLQIPTYYQEDFDVDGNPWLYHHDTKLRRLFREHYRKDLNQDIPSLFEGVRSMYWMENKKWDWLAIILAKNARNAAILKHIYAIRQEDTECLGFCMPYEIYFDFLKDKIGNIERYPYEDHLEALWAFLMNYDDEGDIKYKNTGNAPEKQNKRLFYAPLTMELRHRISQDVGIELEGIIGRLWQDMPYENKDVESFYSNESEPGYDAEEASDTDVTTPELSSFKTEKDGDEVSEKSSEDSKLLPLEKNEEFVLRKFNCGNSPTKRIEMTVGLDIINTRTQSLQRSGLSSRSFLAENYADSQEERSIGMTPSTLVWVSQAYYWEVNREAKGQD